LGFALIDAERQKRTGFPEVVYCQGKTVEQAEAIIDSMAAHKIPMLATRAQEELGKRIKDKYPAADWDSAARTITLNTGKDGESPESAGKGLVAVVCAGTSDLPVAKEAVNTARFFGSRVELISDVGVAGIHRLFKRLPDIRKARVVVAVAGMEGALAGVIAGLVRAPVIALPTSVGYGANFKGVSALLGMLTSCAPGISVVNIDNGFGAGYQANLINRMGET
jgi:NCAIR mutase (PurE)-related protein